jgi:predicted transcriptional regulator
MLENEIATYRSALKEARSSFDRATSRLRAINLEQYELTDAVTRLRKTITALAALCSEAPFSDALGITESCLEVMTAERGSVSTQSVLRTLESIGFDISGQKNAAASVHSVLSRLAEKGKIQKITDEAGGGVTWRGPNYDPQTDEISDDDIPF